MRDRYLELIDQIVTDTLKGNIRSKEQIYHTLSEKIDAGTGELFERCLQTYAEDLQTQLTSDIDELQQAKATRKQRALTTIQGEWERWQKQNQANTLLASVVRSLRSAAPDQQLQELINILDVNQNSPLSLEQLQQLSQLLQQPEELSSGSDSSSRQTLELAQGLQSGLRSWQQLETQVIGWMYKQSQRSLGFGKVTEQRGPWSHWAKAVESDLLRHVFTDLAQHQSITTAGLPIPLPTSSWVELVVVLQRLQLGLVRWFDQQPYDPRAGKRLSIATFLTFTIVWGQLSHRFHQLGQTALTEGCFQMALQILAQFAQQAYFPLYGGLFTALSGESLQTMLDYLDRPLRQTPNTGIKARILILAGYTQQALGHYEQALQFHEQALDIARTAEDRTCEVASLNHLSRTYIAQQNYDDAIANSQRALILARQIGDRIGEANALANFGYSEVLQIQAENPLDSDRYENILVYLEQGLHLSEQVGDRPSQALCTNSLGIVLVVTGNLPAAIEVLKQGVHIAEGIGDRALVSLNYHYLAEAHRGLGQIEAAIYTGSLAMYLLYQIESLKWRQSAGLLSILYGQIGPDVFQEHLVRLRPALIAQIGVDGYDYLPKLLTDYRQSLA
ncbi:MAG: tetratricopeptide repeat protein [Acaryochloris sp. RU_4_1]|nr:tetratricopeptide repeat protein [Acaryochloris sp. RU_4_1]NJR55210.1 tetratricopeptide repeat protein [Acaryochloris sp. CRU_2_0]